MTPSTDSVAPDHYAELHAQFRWQVPEKFNIARECCGRWADGPDAARRIAIRLHQGSEPGRHYSYADLQQQANRLSNALVQLGVQRGDRVAIVLPQRFEAAVAYMAVLQMGAVAMPLSTLFGPDALAFRLRDSEARLALCDAASLGSLSAARSEFALLRRLIAIDAGGAADCLDYAALLAAQPDAFVAVDTDAKEAALLIYTSGTTGDPKGALIPHRALLGNLSGFVCSQNWFGFEPGMSQSPPSPAGGRAGVGADMLRTRSGLPQPKARSVFWSPADWTWTGGLMDALLPTLYFGQEIVAYPGRFSADAAFDILQTHRVTHTFLFPTALKAMMKAYPHPGQMFKLKLQAIMSAGEAVGDAVFSYCQQQLGVTVNEMFGQTEINYIVGNCSLMWPARGGSMGRPYPGHRVAVIDDDGLECPVGVAGDVALNRLDIHGDADPIFFLGYWKNPDATAAKFTLDWCRTGDLATRDADGYLWYQGRSDDMFKAAGYRIGPGEIENCLVKHPAVANAAVVPKPDRERGALVKAYVVLAPEFAQLRSTLGSATPQWDAEMVAQLQAHVKGRLAPYEYPKEIEFIDALPMTTTGKVQRRVLRLQEQARAASA